ncbi:MAG: tyrosine-type recombinase/integrase [Flavobacteriia bacterium]|nr:tyrosine-type recombinase/integrase [Flavobacteriia bacterium]
MIKFNPMPKITFFIRKGKNDILYCRVSYKGTVSEFATHEVVNIKHWNQEQQIYFSEFKNKDRYINMYVQSLSLKLKSNALLCEYKNSKELINSIQPQKEKEPTTLVKIVKDYIEQSQKKKRTGTIRTYEVRLRNLILFEKVTKTKYDEHFSLKEAEKFIAWFMKTRKTTNQTTASRHIEFFKTALKHSSKIGNIKNYELINYEPMRDKPNTPVHLNKDELKKIIHFNFENSKISICKELYLFQISTGISYCDLWNKFTIQKNMLIGTRSKTGQMFCIPIDDIAKNILKKYNGKLPFLCNALYNKYLKHIANKLNIKKRLTTHTGRKTFATLQNENGWSLESIAMMLGHSSVKTTEMYYIGKNFNRLEFEAEKRNSFSSFLEHD